MNKFNLKGKIGILNRQKIIIAMVLSLLFIVIVSILLLIWLPVKPSLAEITNSWVALIIVYLVISILLFEKPIYKCFVEFFTANFQDFKQDNIVNKDNQAVDSIVVKEEEIPEHIPKLHEENTKWRFRYANSYLPLYAKYFLLWLDKSKSVNREEYDNILQPKISDAKERETILNTLLDLEFIRGEGRDIFFITGLGADYVNHLKEMEKSN